MTDMMTSAATAGRVGAGGWVYYPDNRAFIEALRASGDLVQVDREVDWDLEMGAIVRRVCERRGPSPYFTKIKDYEGFEALGAPLATYRKLAVALGMPADSRIPDIAAVYLRAHGGHPDPAASRRPRRGVVQGRGPPRRGRQPVRPACPHGPRRRRRPVPVHLAHDRRGRPGHGRGQLGHVPADGLRREDHGRPGAAVQRHGQDVPRQERAPEPAVALRHRDRDGPAGRHRRVRSLADPEDTLCGMLMGEPVELVKCETNDLLVPAQAEIVIEGEILPGINMYEAPFGEYTGYRTSPREERSVYRVKAITHRTRPILAVSNMGVPTDEGQLLRSFSLALEMEKLLAQPGHPHHRGVHAARVHPPPRRHRGETGIQRHRPAVRAAGVRQQARPVVPPGDRRGRQDRHLQHPRGHPRVLDPLRPVPGHPHLRQLRWHTVEPVRLARRPTRRARLEGLLRLPLAAGVDAAGRPRSSSRSARSTRKTSWTR